jgi:hypothetical protein
MNNAPKIDWIDPIFPALMLTFMLVTAYGGLRGNDPSAIFEALTWLYLAWADRYLTGEREKGLPRKSYLVDPVVLRP